MNQSYFSEMQKQAAEEAYFEKFASAYPNLTNFMVHMSSLQKQAAKGGVAGQAVAGLIGTAAPSKSSLKDLLGKTLSKHKVPIAAGAGGLGAGAGLGGILGYNAGEDDGLAEGLVHGTNRGLRRGAEALDKYRAHVKGTLGEQQGSLWNRLVNVVSPTDYDSLI